MSVQVGQKAPEFSLKTSKMQDFKLSDLQGKKNVVLLFVPLAFTGGWTKEFCSVRDNINTLQNDNTQVVGISVDSPFALDAWAAKEGYNFPLLSDFNKEVSTAYGSLYENLLGFRGIAKRSAFVIDKNGTVQYAWISEDAGKLPELDPIRDCLQKCWWFADGQDETCPHLLFCSPFTTVIKVLSGFRERASESWGLSPLVTVMWLAEAPFHRAVSWTPTHGTRGNGRSSSSVGHGETSC
jgi:glutaredoxin-dependent peroxiredoxin